MGRRTSKKNKEITLVDVKEPDNIRRYYKQRNSLWGEHFRKRNTPERVKILIESFDRHGIEVKGYCAICWDPLTNDFPEDFPEEYRFCCMCRFIARKIAHGDTAEEYTMFDGEDERSFKILERITLMEGNDR